MMLYCSTRYSSTYNIYRNMDPPYRRRLRNVAVVTLDDAVLQPSVRPVLLYQSVFCEGGHRMPCPSSAFIRISFRGGCIPPPPATAVPVRYTYGRHIFFVFHERISRSASNKQNHLHWSDTTSTALRHLRSSQCTPPPAPWRGSVIACPCRRCPLLFFRNDGDLELLDPELHSPEMLKCVWEDAITDIAVVRSVQHTTDHLPQ